MTTVLAGSADETSSAGLRTGTSARRVAPDMIVGMTVAPRFKLDLQQGGLILIILALCVVLAVFGGSHVDRVTGHSVNNFLNASTLVQILTDASFFAIMAVGMTAVIVTGGIDLSIGSIYALAGVGTALVLRSNPTVNPLLGLCLCIGIGLLAGLLNGTMVAKLGVHPFIITLGTMWIYRGLAFVTSKAESISVATTITDFTKANLGLRKDLFPVPALAMVLFAIAGSIWLAKTTWGRRVFAVGGNAEAARYAGLKLPQILAGVYVLTGLAAGLAAFLGSGFYGSASSGDAQGYELYVIASAVVGGASLTGGRGSALGATLGALLIVLIRQSIRTLQLDQNYEWIIIGVAIIVAVVVDRWSARAAAKRV